MYNIELDRYRWFLTGLVDWADWRIGQPHVEMGVRYLFIFQTEFHVLCGVCVCCVLCPGVDLWYKLNGKMTTEIYICGKRKTNTNPNRNRNRKTKTDTVRMHPINSFELLFFAVFGQTTTEQTQVDKIKNLATPTQPYWVEYLFKIVFGIYMLVSVVVLINLLIAMMSDTYQRIQVVLLLLMALLIRFLPTYLLIQLSMLDIKSITYYIYVYYQFILSYLPHKLCMPI